MRTQVADVIRRRGYPISITRPGAPTLTDGYVIPGTPTTINIIGTIQPLSGEEIRNLPPGQNSIDWQNIWSLTELILNDQFTYKGALYRVQQIDDWNPDGKYWRCQAVRVKETL